METLEKSRMCRLCGKQSGIAIDIFDKNECHVRKINAILPILVHEMDLLPKQMCHRCSYKLEEFYNFYVDCAKTDRELKSQLSWMSKEDDEKIAIPMVKMNKFKIKTEPLDNDSIDPNNAFGRFMDSSFFFPASFLQHGSEANLTLPCLQCKCVCNRSMKVNKKSPKEIKASSKSESENEAHNLQIIANNPSVLIEPMDIDHKIKYSEKLFKESKFIETNSKKLTFNDVDNEVFVALDVDNDALKLENINRSLRPRKSSVDYMVSKKKMNATNLKSNVKNRLDNIDVSLINPVDIRITQGNTNHPSPIIKLEKVDDPTLRAQRNLEIFNRRVKEIRRKNLHKKENRHKKNLWREENLGKKIEKFKESLHNPHKKKSHKEENRIKKCLQDNEIEVKCNPQTEKSKNWECSIIHQKFGSNNDLSIVESKKKQEDVKKIIKQDLSSEELVQDALKPVDRLPLCAVVKLEKDYTCNVDYPKIQIKRHLTVTNPQEHQEGGSKPLSKQKDHSKVAINKRSPIENESFLKNLRSNERRLKIRNNYHKTRSSKKDNKQLNFKVKRTVLDKEVSMVFQQSELKRYCENCDTSFRNKELYKLHPCYQN